MVDNTTIAFADFTGSTGLYETLGNTKAAESLTRGTHWIGKLCESRGGRVIKYLGDGVLMVALCVFAGFFVSSGVSGPVVSATTVFVSCGCCKAST